MPDDISDGLPPKGDIQHRINYQPHLGVVYQIATLQHYRMSPKECNFHSKVNELVWKSMIRESMCPCAALASLTPKKDGGWHMCVGRGLLIKSLWSTDFLYLIWRDILGMLEGS